MELIIWLLFGLLIGWISSSIMNVKGKSVFRNIIIGLVGSSIGGWLGRFLGLGAIGKFTLSGFFFAIIGAMILIWLLRKVKI